MKYKTLALILVLLLGGMSRLCKAQQSGDEQAHESHDLDIVQLDGSFDDARSIYITNQPLLYIVETGRHRFLVLNAEGTRLDSIGNQGFGHYQFNRPLDIDATNGLKIYVSDYHNGRIQVFDRRLQFLSSITPPRGNEEFFRYQPTVLAVNDDRELYFYENDNGRLVQYDENGELLTSFRIRGDRNLRSPADLDTRNGQLLLADSARGALHFMEREGQYNKFIGGLEGIRGITTSPTGIWVVTDNRLAQLGEKGRLKREFSWSEPIQPVDVAVSRNYIYLLTPRNLWRGTFSQDR